MEKTTSEASRNPLSTGSSYHLSPAEITDLNEQADRGNAECAYRLYQYYSFSLNSTKRGFIWLSKAASLGDKNAMYSLAVYYLSIERYKQANVWVKRAAAAGHENANELALEIAAEVATVETKKKKSSLKKTE